MPPFVWEFMVNKYMERIIFKPLSNLSKKMKGSYLRIPLLIFVLFFFLLGCSSVKHLGEQKNNYQNIYLADPTILFYEGMYYLYGTVGANADNGFLVYTSKDMKVWSASKEVNNGYALQKGDVYGTKGFWAPQVFIYKNKFYMAYVANENIAIAEGTGPLGPFTQKVKEPLVARGNQIDPFVFIDDDGKKYLYHVRLGGGNKIFVAEMADDFSAIKPETLHECITATEPWENTANSKWPVTEGPTVIKHKNLYYLFYTANDFRNPDYAMGYAVSNSPSGPWRKSTGSPILTKKEIGINGPGHGDMIITKNKKMFFVFHTHNSNTLVSPRRTAMIEIKFSKDSETNIDKLSILPKTYSVLKLKAE
jgi:xylan 1,4-beta-xylosidase